MRTRVQVAAWILLAASGALAFVTLVMPISLRPAGPDVRVGEAASQDWQALQADEFVSEVLTEQARREAERAAQPVYSSPDPAIARAELDRLRAVLQFMDSVRSEAGQDSEQKAAKLTALSSVQISQQGAEAILGFSETEWAAVQQESLRVLEQVMRSPVREEAQEVVRAGVPSLVSLNLSSEQAEIVSTLVLAYIIPNSFYSADLTDAAREAARQSVQPVTRTFVAGQTVIQRGQLVTEADMEALQKLGIIRQEASWQNYLGAAAAVVLLCAYTGLYSFRRRLGLLRNLRHAILAAVLFLVFLFAARVTIPDRAVIPYVFPLPAFGILMAALFGAETGMMLSLPLAILTGYGFSSDLSLYFLLSSWSGILALGQARRMGVFFRAGAGSALAGAAVIAAYRIPFTNIDWLGTSTLIGASAINGLAAAGIALLLQALLAQQLGLTTSLQLLEISRPDFSLLQFFLRNAPGTYQHSLQVANLAEQAGEAIGVDTLLIRVGALYHDCGKAANPQFFIENQLPGSINTHDDMQPHEAAELVIRHVSDGLALARKHHLPDRILDFIGEHHGTLAARYQYNRAVEAAGGDQSKVDINRFRYPGPSPRSRETAIMMLADGVEARTRAERPKTEVELRAIIRRVMDHCQQDGQLDNTKLTLRDLHLITEAFVTALRGIYHPRIEYPSLERPASASPTVPAERKDQA